MVPKKANDFRKTVAEELGLPENLVNDFIDFFWDRVRTHMSNLDYESIYIPNLGTFKVKHWKIDQIVESHKATIIRVEGKFAGYKMKVDLTDRIEKLEKIKAELQEREIKFKKIRDARKSKNNLEEQVVDPTRFMEQNIQDRPGREDLQRKNEDMQSMS